MPGVLGVKDGYARLSGDEGELRSHLPGGGARGTGETLQFCSAIYYALEGTDTEVEVDVIRFGCMDGYVEASYYTEDASAVAGRKYEAQRGVVTLGPGESITTLRFGILDDDLWNSTLEFTVQLADPVGCELSPEQRTCRVKIIDDDVFPGNRYKHEIMAERLEDVPAVTFMVEYLRLALSQWPVMWRTIVVLLIDATESLHFLLSTYLGMYMVDTLFSAEEGSEEGLFVQEPRTWGAREYSPRELTAFVVALLFVLPCLLLHALQLLKIQMDLSGVAEEFLQTNLFRKYLNFDEETRSASPSSAISYAIVDGCAELGQVALLKSVGLVRLVSKFAILIFFVRMEQEEAMPALLALLAAVLLWACLRAGKLSRLQEAEHHAKQRVIHCTQKASECYRLIADYRRRSAMTDRFAGLISEMHRQRVPLLLARENSIFCPTLLSGLAAAAVVALLAPLVLSRAVSVGTCLALRRILLEFGEESKEAYREVMEVLNCSVALRNITALMNGRTELAAKREAHRATRQAMWEHRGQPQEPAAGSQRSAPGALPSWGLDRVPIACSGVRFRYDAAGGWLIDTAELEAAQGQLVALIGPHKGGKTTFLKLLAQIVFPQEGQVFMPTHLRVLHVSQDPLLLEASLWDNLTHGEAREEPRRVRGILARLGVPDVLEILDSELKTQRDEPRWWARLSKTDVAKIHMARALIANFEVLVVHRPCAHFDPGTGNLILDMIGEYIEGRGVDMEAPKWARRPRTCFYTSDYPDLETQWADQVWEVGSGQVRRLPHRCWRGSDGHAHGGGVVRTSSHSLAA